MACSRTSCTTVVRGMPRSRRWRSSHWRWASVGLKVKGGLGTLLIRVLSQRMRIVADLHQA